MFLLIRKYATRHTTPAPSLVFLTIYYTLTVTHICTHYISTQDALYTYWNFYKAIWLTIRHAYTFLHTPAGTETYVHIHSHSLMKKTQLSVTYIYTHTLTSTVGLYTFVHRFTLITQTFNYIIKNPETHTHMLPAHFIYAHTMSSPDKNNTSHLLWECKTHRFCLHNVILRSSWMSPNYVTMVKSPLCDHFTSPLLWYWKTDFIQ